jgi:hypothetical protein
MASEKAIYWTAVIVLALAVTNGFVKQYRGRVSDLMDCAVAWIEERSAVAADSLNLRAPGRENGDLNQVLRSRVHLARVDCNLARPQVEMVRVRVEKIRGRAMEHKLHEVIKTPGGSFVIDAPQPAKVFEHGMF